MIVVRCQWILIKLNKKFSNTKNQVRLKQVRLIRGRKNKVVWNRWKPTVETAWCLVRKMTLDGCVIREISGSWSAIWDIGWDE